MVMIEDRLDEMVLDMNRQTMGRDEAKPLTEDFNFRTSEKNLGRY